MNNFNLSNNRFPYQDVRNFPTPKVPGRISCNAFGSNYNNGYDTHAVTFTPNQFMELSEPLAGPSAILLENTNVLGNRREHGAGTRTVDASFMKTHSSKPLSSHSAQTTTWHEHAILPRAPATQGYKVTSTAVGETSGLPGDTRLETSVSRYTRGQSGVDSAASDVREVPKRAHVLPAFTKQSRRPNLSTSPVAGLHVLSGNVERVLKWYKIMQGLEVECLIEVIARCVKIRAGKKMEKHILLRDQTGPVIQVVFYEIDFFMIDIPIPSAVRIVGKMTGSNKMQAYKVRPVTGAEMTTLPRLAAISQHVVIKLEKEKTLAT